MGFKDRKGEVNRATNGMLMTIVEYRCYDDLDVKFEDGTIVYSKTYQSFKSGRIKNPNVPENSYYKRKGKSKKCIVFNVEYESFKKACEQFKINDDTAREYKDKYKLTEEQTIDHYVNGTDYSNADKVNGVRVNNFTKIVVINGIRYNYGQAIDKYNLSNKGIDKVMREHNIDNKGDAIIFCIQHGLAKKTRKQSGKIRIEGINFSSVKYALKHFRIADITYRKYRDNLNTKDSVIIINSILSDRITKRIKTNIGDFDSFSGSCNKLGFSENNIAGHTDSRKRSDKLIAITRIVKGAYINTDGTLIIPDKIELNIVKKNKVDDEHKKFLACCKKLGINIKSAISYKTRHPELSNNEIILYYRPDCYINILGELVIPK